MRILVVTPTYDEAENIAEALRRIRSAAPQADVLVVDDSSPDGTAELAKATAQELGQIDVLVRERKEGLGNAYRHGFRVGMDRGYDVLIQIDADLSHDATSGYRAYRVGALNDIDVFGTRAKGYGFQIETAYRVSRSGRRLSEVPIEFTDRVRGYSKMSASVMAEELLLVTWWGVRDRAKALLARLRRRSEA